MSPPAVHHVERLHAFERLLRRLWHQTQLEDLWILGGERLQIIRLLGHGASAVVCEAMDRKWDKRVAVKLFPSPSEDRGLQAVEHEARSLGRLVHPNVVSVLDFDRTQLHPGDLACHWLSMELIDGDSLRAWLGQPRKDVDVLAVLRQVGEGLAFAHDRGFVHRDLKPENVMITTEGVPKLVDFGLAVATGAVADPRGAVGTPAFMAPEALRGHSDDRSDQFSFAATLWLALCRDFPYDPASRDPAMRRPNRMARAGLSSSLVASLRRALDPDPARRFPKMRDLLDELDDTVPGRRAPAAVVQVPVVPPPAQPVLSSAPAPAPESSPVLLRDPLDVELSDRMPSSPTRPRSWQWWLGLTAIGGGVAAAAVFMMQPPRDGTEPAASVMIADAPSEPSPPGPGPADAPVEAPAAAPPSASSESPATPPTCATPALVGGRWSFSTAVQSASRKDLEQRIGRYELEVRIDTASCKLGATFSKLGNDLVTYDPPLTDEAALEFAVSPPFAARLTGTIKPHVDWDTAAYTYEFAFIVEGNDLYGSFKARATRGGDRFDGLLRGRRGRIPRSPASRVSITDTQPCLSRCALRCPQANCEASCTSADRWGVPDCRIR